VFYRLDSESLVGLNDQVIVPASEIIHDRMNPIYHPLVGVSPLYAAAGSVTQGLRIQENAVHFFANHSRPGGVLTAPGALEDETIAQLKEQWEANYSGHNSGKVAILADGLKYDSFQRQSAADSQVIEQLGWSSSVVCSVFHVPQYMV
ncbi:MAG: phage portal protein, partial [Coleofasciculus sp. C2-GNP5-27]